MSTGPDNDGGGPSKPFWELSQEWLEEVEGDDQSNQDDNEDMECDEEVGLPNIFVCLVYRDEEVVCGVRR